MSEKTRRDVDQGIAEKAKSDAAFRARIKSDPKAVLAEMGLSVRDGINVNVVEESATDCYIVLPKAGAAAGADGELGDDALDAVNAGMFTSSCYSCGAG